jgi:NAD(P)-dependent dehydrogenase (short-subunit alcohol dehydrogenase family)
MSSVFLLTGSARGLGRSIAVAILEAGHRLIATARQPAQLDDLVARYGDSVLPLALDVTNFEGAKAAVRSGVRRFGRLDVVINNAGFGNVGAVEDMPIADIASQFETNFMGSVHVIKAALPVLRRQGAGRVIQISSIGARIATPGAAAYYATKWALSGFVESLAAELAPLGIQVTAMEPGGMKTDFATASSMTILSPSPAYESTVGATVNLMQAPDYVANYAHPADVAAVVMKVAELEAPPVRLLVGAANYAYVRAVEEARLQADERWKWLTAACDRG